MGGAMKIVPSRLSPVTMNRRLAVLAGVCSSLMWVAGCGDASSSGTETTTASSSADGSVRAETDAANPSEVLESHNDSIDDISQNASEGNDVFRDENDDIGPEVTLGPPNRDGDLWLDEEDNCPETINDDQEDHDQDGMGDACDPDDDGDYVLDEQDNCPLTPNLDQADTDENGLGDACENDDDHDDIADGDDNCPSDQNYDQDDTDDDGEGDACDIDDDADGVLDEVDNCPKDANVGQKDTDNDAQGDACDTDDDGDKVVDEEDNCPLHYNASQKDTDFDGLGDPCDDFDDLWLLNVDNDNHQLLKVDIHTAVGVPVCQLETEDSYPSLTFNRSGDLYGANNDQDRLDKIDPCTCAITPMGDGFGLEGEQQVVGITADLGFNLFGVEKSEDLLLSVDVGDGLAQGIGPFCGDTPADQCLIAFENSGATWSDSDNALYAINSDDDGLYLIDADTGTADFVATLTVPFGSVGIELHPGNDVIYACTNNRLYRVNRTPGDNLGEATFLGEISDAKCNNLAAPYTQTSCPGWD
jgi:hypothetical protein